MTYRVLERGYRHCGPIAGLVRCGSIVERWDEDRKVWVYVDCVHPDDVEKVKRENRSIPIGPK